MLHCQNCEAAHSNDELMAKKLESNANILFKPGKKLSTVSTMKNIMAEANVEDEFESDLYIEPEEDFL